MSVNKNYYVIAGYDLTGETTEKYKEWHWSDEAEKYTCRQRRGQLQLFDDPISGNYLYFGYVLADGGEYEFANTQFPIYKVDEIRQRVDDMLCELIDLGVIKTILFGSSEYKIIAFEQYS